MSSSQVVLNFTIRDLYHYKNPNDMGQITYYLLIIKGGVIRKILMIWGNFFNIINFIDFLCKT